jgi:hypothetical protein
VESAKENLEWVEKHGSEIESWLKFGTSSTTTPGEASSLTTPGEASSLSLSPVLYMTLFFSILHQIVTTLK